MRTLLAFFVFAVLCLPANAVLLTQENPGAFEVSSYLGEWYDFARTANNFQDNTPERDGVKYSGCFDSTAEYKLKNSKTITLVNTCYRRGEDGSLDVEDISGKAKVAKKSHGTRLKVAFGGFVARFFQRVFTFGGANYWIYAVGDKNAEGEYSWALVSGPKKDYIFVLTRSLRVEPEVKEEIVKTATDLGLPVDELIFNEDR